MKRAFVPAALHAELTEHAHLVRVLRTTHTLDLTAHLLQHAARQDHEADTWTTWPLIDCPVPEWSLEDEIRALAETVVRADNPRDAGSDDETLGSDEDSERGLSPAATRRLVLHAGALLVRVLNLLVDQRPAAPGSMQNRLWAMNWEDVVALLGVSGAVDPVIVARALERLERIYGPSSAQAVERLRSATSAMTRGSSMAAVAEAQLFACPVLSPRIPRSDARGPAGRHEPGITSRAVVEDAEADA